MLKDGCRNEQMFSMKSEVVSHLQWAISFEVKASASKLQNYYVNFQKKSYWAHVHCVPLRITGELLNPTADPVEPAHLVTQLRQHMVCLIPVSAAYHASPTTFVHKNLHNCTLSFSVRTQHAGLWITLTVAPTRSSLGGRKHCICVCAASLSPCLASGWSQPTCWTRPTAQTPLSTPRPTQSQP
jgi:hypothetical protein